MTATLQSTPDGAAARRALDHWTRAALVVMVVPLLLWGAISVFELALTVVKSWPVALIPAVSTTGVMLVATRVSQLDELSDSIRAYAKRLAVFAISLDVLVAGVQHTLPATLNPAWGWRFLIGLLPPLMGGITAHLVALVIADYRRLNAGDNAKIAQAEQLRLSKIEAEATADRERAATVRAEEQITQIRDRERIAELDHARELAGLAERTAQAVQRQAAAQATVAHAVEPGLHSVPDPAPDGPTDALGRKARPSEKRDAALRWLLHQHRNGRDLDTVTAAEVDRVIGANRYSHKHLSTWIRDVRAHARKAA